MADGRIGGFTRGNRCVARLGITILEDMPTGSATGKRPRESSGHQQRRGLRPRDIGGCRGVEPRLAEAELQVAQAKLEAARASRVAAVSGGSEAVVTAQPRSYASALRLPGRERADKKTESGPVLAIYPVAEQIDNIKTAEETKTLLKNAINPASMQVQVTKVRKVGRAGVVANHVCRIGGENSEGGPAHAGDGA
ncbi:hypothetical protein EVAR_90003_1 [Eumeta japonica]|uniref:Uncharacterized protein n=1 Tax=Eumeta variegata TaxID=151549 RepID=A0A4C2A9B1_EUMVA|nr:hypothetical protein EVAR_90003_1 [Eumeta japonica]